MKETRRGGKREREKKVNEIMAHEKAKQSELTEQRSETLVRNTLEAQVKPRVVSNNELSVISFGLRWTK